MKDFQSLRSCLHLALRQVLGDVIPVLEKIQRCGVTAMMLSLLICAFLSVLHDFQLCETGQFMNREHFSVSHRTEIGQQEPIRLPFHQP